MAAVLEVEVGGPVEREVEEVRGTELAGVAPGGTGKGGAGGEGLRDVSVKGGRSGRGAWGTQGPGERGRGVRCGARRVPGMGLRRLWVTLSLWAFGASRVEEC